MSALLKLRGERPPADWEAVVAAADRMIDQNPWPEGQHPWVNFRKGVEPFGRALLEFLNITCEEDYKARQEEFQRVGTNAITEAVNARRNDAEARLAEFLAVRRMFTRIVLPVQFVLVVVAFLLPNGSMYGWACDAGVWAGAIWFVVMARRTRRRVRGIIPG